MSKRSNWEEQPAQGIAAASQRHPKSLNREGGPPRGGNSGHFGRNFNPRGRTSIGLSLEGYMNQTPAGEIIRQGIGELLPNWYDSKDPKVVTAFSDNDAVYTRTMSLDAITNIAEHISDTNGIGSVIDAISSPALVKDWVTAQRTAYLEDIFYGVHLIHQLAVQGVYRQKMKLLTESDAGIYWTQESYDSFYSALESRALVVPKISYNIAHDLCPVFTLHKSYPRRDIPAWTYIPWNPTISLATARTYRDAIMTRQGPALLHARKADLPMVPLNKALIEACAHDVDFHSNEGLFWYLNTPIMVDVGGTENIIDHQGRTAKASGTTAFNANTAAAYTNAVIGWVGPRAPDVWCLARLLHSYSTNNYMGMLTLPSVANDTMAFKYCNLMGTAQTEMPYPSYMSSVWGLTSAVWRNGLTWTDTQSDTLYRDNDPKWYGTDYWEKTSLSQAEWIDLERGYFNAYGRGKSGGKLDEQNAEPVH